MKRILILFTLVLLVVAGCKKGSKDSVDPRDQYVGIYDTEFTSKTTIGTIVPFAPDKGNGTLTFTKGDAANELRVVITFVTYNREDVATLNGSKFTLSRTKDKLGPIGAKTYDADFAASGEFTGNQLTIASTWKTVDTGTTILRDGTFKGVKR